MKISVVVIAHNEEKHISRCIESILSQTEKPNEVIVVIHNSNAKTLEIANNYKVTAIPYFTEEYGPIYPRIKGIEQADGDIILCTDGDSLVSNNWIEVMTKTLTNNDNILIGSYVKISGTLFESISNIFNKYLCKTKNGKAVEWIWGASFGFGGKDKNFVLDVFRKIINYSKELKLQKGRIAEDYWLALYMNEKGNIEVTNKTSVTSFAQNESIIDAIKRTNTNHKNGYLIKEFFKKNKTLIQYNYD